jgi:uncharacterized surface protein with fasciclin (FAS1) repeats
MKKLIASFALALTALTLNTVQADAQPQQRPNQPQPRQKIAQGTTAPANSAAGAAQQATQSGQQAVKNAQNAVNNGTTTQPTTTPPVTPSEPGTLPKPRTDGSGFLITQRAPMQNADAPPAKPTETITIAEVTTTDPTFGTLAQALQASGLANTLKGTGPYTIFAPNDKAFAKLSPNALHDLLRPENKAKLANVLSSHVVAGKITAGSLKTSKLKTINGQTLDVKVTDQGITVNNAKVEKAAIPTANGTIYIIDTVLQP